jgi:hypothetical protein
MGINVIKRNGKYLLRVKGFVEVLTADELDDLKFRIELANGDLPAGPEAYQKKEEVNNSPCVNGTTYAVGKEG